MQAELSRILQLNQSLHPVTRDVLESVQSILPLVEDQAPALQASKLSLLECTRLLAIDFELDEAHRWILKEKRPSKPLSEWASTAIRNIRGSKYLRAFRPESIVRTLFDLLICDRLEILDDSFMTKHLKVASEIQMQASTKDDVKISGRADWTLGYMDEKDNLKEMLVVVEAKARGSLGTAIPQLFIYLVAIQDARAKAGKENQIIFGMATDSDQFLFAILKEGRKGYVSKPIDWIEDKDQVISFLDHILQDAIDSSPHTTPKRTRNKKIKRFDESLTSTYSFGHEERPYADEDGLAWNVVEINGVSLLQPCGDLDDEILKENPHILALSPPSSS